MDKPRTFKGAAKGHRDGAARKGGPRKPDARPAAAGKPFRPASGSKPGFRPGSASKPAFRPAVADKPADGKRPIITYPDLDKRRRIEDAERAALGRVTVLAGDALALGCNSSHWPEFQDTLRARLAQLDAAKIVLSDRIAAIWNKNGFRTGAGQQWTARLVDVAKKVIAEAKPAEPPPV
ncbi:MAG TPA: hypothetical protein VHT93_16870 [Pseudolabrys sp.]|nr:hypothetical protein [Pseudolabrys sp.]